MADGIRKREALITLLAITPIVGALIYRRNKKHYASKIAGVKK